jgi:hypothetical protein
VFRPHCRLLNMHVPKYAHAPILLNVSECEKLEDKKFDLKCMFHLFGTFFYLLNL